MFNFRLLPELSRQRSDNKSYLQKVGGELEVSVRMGQLFELVGEYGHFYNESLNPEFDNLKGHSRFGSFGFDFFKDKFILEYRAILTNDNFQDNRESTLSRRGIGSTLSFFLFPNESFSISSILNWLNEKYEKDQFNEIRKSNLISLTLGLRFNLSKKFSLYLNNTLSIVDDDINAGFVDEFEASQSKQLFEFNEQFILGATWVAF